MAKLTRKNQKLFGSIAAPSQIGVFGSLAAGDVDYSSDPEVIQSLSNYLVGWFGAVVGLNSPAIEDMNALFYLYAYQLCYMFQTGVPEWNSATTYYIGSVVNNGSGVLYASLTDNNLNNALTSTANWKVLASNPMTTLGDITYGAANGVQTRLAGNTTTTQKYLGQKGTGSASVAPAWTSFAPRTQQIFNANSSGTYTLPAGCLYIVVKLLGAGGGGGGSSTTSGTQSSLGNAGGGGAFLSKLITNPAATYAYVVGQGGLGGLAGQNDGQNGAASTFGTLSAGGGFGGAGDAAHSAAFASSLGGGGGNAFTGGDIQIQGQSGNGNCIISANGLVLIPGGGGNALSPGVNIQPYNTPNASGPGQAAPFNGVGGGGGLCQGTVTQKAGGNGGDGLIIVEEYYA